MSSSLLLEQSWDVGKAERQEVSWSRSPDKGGLEEQATWLGLFLEGKEEPLKDFKLGTELISKISLVTVWDECFIGASLGPGR